MSSGSAWTDVEDQKLLVAIKKAAQCEKGFKSDLPLENFVPIKDKAFWKKVAAIHKNGRTDNACIGRWMSKLNTQIFRGKWTPAEDQKLLEMFSSKEFNTWVKRSIELGRLFHGGVRRGGAETCNRYFQLKKGTPQKVIVANKGSTSSAVKKKGEGKLGSTNQQKAKNTQKSKASARRKLAKKK